MSALFRILVSKKNAAKKPHYREGYKALNSKKEVCISRVGLILPISIIDLNVANRHATDCHTPKG